MFLAYAVVKPKFGKFYEREKGGVVFDRAPYKLSLDSESGANHFLLMH